MVATTKIDPFELHPETPRTKRSMDRERITVAQLSDIVEDLSTKVRDSPDKIWGHSRVDVEKWLRMVIHEAEKVVTESCD